LSEQFVEQQTTGKIACFGKIRAKGDFVSRNLDYQTQEYLDGWLQQAISISQGQIGEGWLRHYLTSPIWRFVISNKEIGKDIIGFMMPSIDKVGRYYPLFMLETYDEGKLCGEDLSCKSFAELEELAMSTLDGSDESSAFFESLNQAAFPLYGEEAPVPRILQNINCGEAGIRSEVLEYLWQESLDFTSFRHEQITNNDVTGIWWTEGSKTISPTLIYCSGLPPIDGFSALIDGDWERWGWQEKIMKEEEESFAAE